MEEKGYEAISREEIEDLTLGEVMNLPFDVDADPRYRFGIDDDIYCAWQALNVAIEREFPGFGEGRAPVSLPAAMAAYIVKFLMDGRLITKK